MQRAGARGCSRGGGLASRVTAGGSSWSAAGTGGGVVAPVRRTPEVPLGLQPDREEGAGPERAGTPIAAFYASATEVATECTRTGCSKHRLWRRCGVRMGPVCGLRQRDRRGRQLPHGRAPPAGHGQRPGRAGGGRGAGRHAGRGRRALSELPAPQCAHGPGCTRSWPAVTARSATGAPLHAPWQPAGPRQCRRASAARQVPRTAGRGLCKHAGEPLAGEGAGTGAPTRPRGRQARATRSRCCASRARGAAGGWRARGRWSSRWQAWRPARCCTRAHSRCASGTRARRAASACPAWCALPVPTPCSQHALL
jgi:hypothetical protein